MKGINFYWLIFLSFSLLHGCNTIDGIGRDISAGAEWVSETANAKK